MAKEIIILSPCDGIVKELSKVNDPVFSKEMIGKGFAITPTKETKEIVSPIVKGKVKMAFDGGHAYGIDIGKIEILVHIGIETVMLKGRGFEQKIFSGDKIKKGTVLTGVDLKIIDAEATSTDVMILITNESIGDLKIERIAGNTVKVGEPLYKLVN